MNQLSSSIIPSSQPVPSAERIVAIDVLRGLALFGVLMVNLVTEFRVSIFAQFLPPPALQSTSDRLVALVVSEGLEAKAFCLFSLLFGVGLAIQFDRLGSTPGRLRLMIRRLAALMVFGLVHLFLIWNGDILTEYAVAGLLVLPLLFAPRRVLGASSALFLLFYAAMPLMRIPIPFPSGDWIAAHIVEANAVYARGGYREVVSFNMQEVASLVPLHLFVLARTLGLITLGAWLWKAKMFSTANAMAFAACGVIGITLGVLLMLWLRPMGVLHGPGLEAVAAMASQIAPVVLALGYGGAILAVGTASRTRWMVAWAAPLGRMAFTNYLAQSFIFGWVFFGYGLGLFNAIGPAWAFTLGLLVYTAQALASSIWLRYFQFGPLEWLWRALTYGHRPPIYRMARSAPPRPN